MSDQIVTSPIITDETGQDILSAIENLASVINPNAQGVSFDKTGCAVITTNNVQDGMKQLDSGLDTVSSNLTQLITTQDISLGTQTVNQNDRGVFSANVSKDGYIPIGIIGITLQSNYMTVGSFRLDPNTENIQIVIWNYYARPSSSQTVSARVLYIKNLAL